MNKLIQWHKKESAKLYGCHTKRTHNRLQHKEVAHSQGNVKWDYVFTDSCQYQLAIKDDKQCKGCDELKK